MDIRKAINRLLTEDHKHDYGCAMLYFDFPQIKDIHNQIDKDDLYVDEEDPSFGLENEPHCTLLFGLHPEVSTEDVQDILSQSNIVDLPYVGNNISLFENEYDLSLILLMDFFVYTTHLYYKLYLLYLLFLHLYLKFLFLEWHKIK